MAETLPLSRVLTFLPTLQNGQARDICYNVLEETCDDEQPVVSWGGFLSLSVVDWLQQVRLFSPAEQILTLRELLPDLRKYVQTALTAGARADEDLAAFQVCVVEGQFVTWTYYGGFYEPRFQKHLEGLPRPAAWSTLLDLTVLYFRLRQIMRNQDENYNARSPAS